MFLYAMKLIELAIGKLVQVCRLLVMFFGLPAFRYSLPSITYERNWQSIETYERNWKSIAYFGRNLPGTCGWYFKPR